MKKETRQKAEAGLLEGTVAEIEAAEAEVVRRRSLGAPITEVRSAYMKVAILCRHKKRPGRRAIDTRLRLALEAKDIASKAEKNISGLVNGVSLSGVVGRIATIGETALLDAIQQDLGSTDEERRDRAMAYMMKLMSDIVDLYRALTTMQSSGKARMARPGWPSEAQKA